MSQRGSDNRQRELTLSARFNEREAEAIRQMADHAGVSVAAVIPGAVLNAPIPRAAAVARPIRRTPHAAAAFRDLAEMRTVCFLAMGASHDPERQPARRRR
jgi:hypothetical protein